jgi:hypothetical protein
MTQSGACSRLDNPRREVENRKMAENGRPTVSVLFPEHHEEAAVALGRAFINDPTFKAILPEVTEPVERAGRLADLFRALLSIERKTGAWSARRSPRVGRCRARSRWSRRA